MPRFLSRRRFLQNAAGVSALGAFGALERIKANSPVPSSQQRERGRLPMLQLASTQTQVQIKVLRSFGHSFQYQVRERSEGNQKTLVRWVTPAVVYAPPVGTGDFVDHLWIDTLPSDGASFELLVFEAHSGQMIDQRFFKTLNQRNLRLETLKIAQLSCMNDRYVDDQASMWQAVDEVNPDIMIWNGDLCYLDQRWDGTIEGLWQRQVTTRRMLDVFYWKSLVPAICGWDDHDTAQNDADSSNPLLEVTEDCFRAFFGALPVSGLSAHTERSYRFDHSGLRLIFLDGRSERRNQQVYSDATLSWLRSELSHATGPVFLVSGMQFFGGYLLGGESVERYSAQQLGLIAQFSRQCPFPVVFLSGDVHFSEVMQLEPRLLGYPSFELTSSAIHSRTFPGQQFRSMNPRRVSSTSWWNFLAFDVGVDSTGLSLHIDLSCRGRDQSVFFQHSLLVEKS